MLSNRSGLSSDVIDLTNDSFAADIDDFCPDSDDIVDIISPKEALPKRPKLSGKNKQVGRRRNIRFDQAHIQSPECTQICFDNQQAMELYRKSSTCAICLDTLRDLTSTNCGHIFCRQCIVQAVQTTLKCPMCQKPTHLDGIHPIFL
ncbi:unnamed protein product [Aphanomyces euteiches]